jgi:hypothetical protein
MFSLDLWDLVFICEHILIHPSWGHMATVQVSDIDQHVQEDQGISPCVSWAHQEPQTMCTKGGVECKLGYTELFLDLCMHAWMDIKQNHAIQAHAHTKIVYYVYFIVKFLTLWHEWHICNIDHTMDR